MVAFKIVRNDITKMDTEAIVNTANDHATVGTGCDSAVYKAAGYEKLLNYRKEKIGFVPEGEAFITPGFDLKAKYIIHAVSPLYMGGKEGEEEKLRSCYQKSLQLAKENGIRSIAFPLISTGGFGYPKEEGLRIAVDEINAFLMHHYMDIFLVVFDDKAKSLGRRLYPQLEEYIDQNYVEEKNEEEYGDGFFASAYREERTEKLLSERDMAQRRRQRLENLRQSERDWRRKTGAPAPAASAPEPKASGALPSVSAPGPKAPGALPSVSAPGLKTPGALPKASAPEPIAGAPEPKASASAPIASSPEPKETNAKKKSKWFSLGTIFKEEKASETNPWTQSDSASLEANSLGYADKAGIADAADSDLSALEEADAEYVDFETEHEGKLQERIKHIADTFSEYLMFLIKEKHMENAEVYKRAIVDKKIFSKIKNNVNYHPQKFTALRLCIGARLNLDESKDLLARAGYALSPCDLTDIIFSYFIENEIYDMLELDIQLEEHGLPCIIS